MRLTAEAINANRVFAFHAEVFSALFPDGCEVDAASVARLAESGFNVDALAANLLSSEGFYEYAESVRAYRDVYESETGPQNASFTKAVEKAGDRYMLTQFEKGALEKYDDSVVFAALAYKEATKQEWQRFLVLAAPCFVAVFNRERGEA